MLITALFCAHVYRLPRSLPGRDDGSVLEEAVETVDRQKGKGICDRRQSKEMQSEELQG